MWVEKPIAQLIEECFVQANIPNSNIEPLLYELVKKFQIHGYKESLYGGPQAPTSQCQKGFPTTLSSRTYYKEGNLRYTYKRVLEVD